MSAIKNASTKTFNISTMEGTSQINIGANNGSFYSTIDKAEARALIAILKCATDSED